MDKLLSEFSKSMASSQIKKLRSKQHRRGGRKLKLNYTKKNKITSETSPILYCYQKINYVDNKNLKNY